MANSLLETCNNWQIQRAEILSRNPDMAMAELEQACAAAGIRIKGEQVK
ncbi:hypothetical protein HVC23_002245 [Salmonella enterica]|nr:hypothetical protein [Salmonella enterica]HCU5617558.1 hypothetical protein [Escherichia coli]